jgi:hypothetical protein
MNWVGAVLSVGIAAVCALTAWGDVTGQPSVVAAMERLGVPGRLVPWLALAKSVAAAGLLAGIVAPAIAVTAAAGASVYFAGAVHAHVRVRDGAAHTAPAFILLTASLLLVGVSLAR